MRDSLEKDFEDLSPAGRVWYAWNLVSVDLDNISLTKFDLSIEPAWSSQ